MPFTVSHTELFSFQFTEEMPKESDGHLTINSPTDIYKYFLKKTQTAPKSILKSPSFERTLPQENIPSVPVKKIEQENTFQREKVCKFIFYHDNTLKKQ